MINFNLVDQLDRIQSRFRECTPRILVVTDGGLNGGPGDFGLSHFLDVLKGVQVHGMTPNVVHRDRNDGGLDQAFDDLSISKFEVLFVFGITTTGSALGAPALTKVKQFMQDGGGVFATGDHDDLGTGMSGEIPRVRAMRYWAASETPDASDSTRVTTNLPGVDRVYAFNDQADDQPQRLYPNFAVGSDGLVIVLPGGFSPARPPHPLLRLADGSALDVYPDHPHEGECRIPDDLATTFDLNGSDVFEWPGGPFAFNRPRPRAIAHAMSAGNGFGPAGGGPKSAVVPRSFITIAAYDGHGGGVGRVVTDATWHHYVNINLGGMRPGGVSNADMLAIERYWANLLNWLMPAKVRRCLWPWLVIRTLALHPILEEIRIPDPRPDAARELEVLGAAVVGAIDELPGSIGSDVVTDALSLLAGRADDGDEWRDGAALSGRVVSSAGHALVGAHVADIAHSLSNDADAHDSDGLARVVRDVGPDVVGSIVDTELEFLRRARDEVDRTKSLLTPQRASD